MRIRNQFIISTAVFSIVLVIVAGSIIYASQQIAQLDKQQEISGNIEQGSDTLNTLSSQYFLYQQSQQLTSWQTNSASILGNLSNLTPTTSEQQSIINSAKGDLVQLNVTFSKLVSFLESAPRNVSVRIMPEFQNDWNQTVTEHQTFGLDASKLSESLRTESDQLRMTNLGLIVVLLGVFGAFFLTNYLITYRRTLKSISSLQAGLKIVGSGNLDYSIQMKQNDEVGEISESVNQMTTNLRTVTASKADLEREMAERKKAEAEREIMAEFLKIANTRNNTHDLILATVDFFQKQSGCEAVGIRLKDGDDYPYYEAKGFPPEHIQLENKLCARDEAGCVIRDFKGDPVIECMCGNVLCGRFAPSQKFFTEKGSFWANDTTRLLATTTDDDRQANTRNRCNGEGYESVALLALKVGNNRLGLLQLNDKRKDMFALETIEMWERIADHLSLALSKTLAEESLRESEERWATTLSSIGDAVIATDTDGKITFMNAVAEELTGWTQSEALQEPLKKVFHIINEKTRQEVESPIGKVLEKGVIIGLANHTILVRRDNTEIPLDDSGAPIKDEAGKITGVVLVFHDITERKQMLSKLEDYSKNLEQMVEEKTKQLKDAERLAAIGATAGMVGHDIRNPLQAITSDVYLAKTELVSFPESEEKKNVNESLEEIEKNISYINKIVADLQDFARPLSPRLEEIDLEQSVHAVLARLNIPGNVTVKHSIRNGFPKLNTDPLYLQRIITNLANNGIQAMPKGGKLTISAVTKNGRAVISVEDNGEGIPEEVRSKMFTPLVTTKSKGQGFGLSVVKRFTEALGGTVTFETEIGKGTKFTIDLPT